ncbi:MAG: fatty acid cis/trans isomerase [Bacteriovorax sp.]
MRKWGPTHQKMVAAFITILMTVGGFFSYYYFNKSAFKEAHYSQSSARLPSSFNEAHHFPNDEFVSKVQPLLAKRCVACHSCYEAPCLMHLTSYEGIQRGLTKHEKFEVVNDLPANRLKDAPLYMGENNTPRWDQPEWTKRYFAPVLQAGSNGQIDMDKSILALALMQGKANTSGFSLDQSLYPPTRTCSQKPEDLKSVYQKYPQSGMPYALPSLEDSEYQVLNEWMQKGAPGPTMETKLVWNQPSRPDLIVKFESFFNATSPKEKLSMRYIYEHSFMTHIHFKGTPHDEFYELIRASNSSGDPKEVVTEKSNDPTPVPFVYRLRRIHDVIVRKTHGLWDLDEGSLAEWKALFLEPTWPNESNIQAYIDSLGPKDRQDPMKYFAPIPETARYTFMVKNAEMLVGEVVRSPSCSGKIATLAIKDHFWVLFMTPEASEKYLQKKRAAGPLKENVLSKLTNKIDIVPADEKNVDPHMSLSLFRHLSNVTVHKGLWGGTPQNIWLMDYDNYEDLYYNLVVNYRPWAKLAHQVLTWQHMVYNRKEAETRFIDYFLSDDKDCKKCKKWFWERWEKGVYDRDANEQAKMDTTFKRAKEKIISAMDDRSGTKVDQLNDDSKKTTDNPDTMLGKWEKQMLELTHKKNVELLRNFPELMYVKLVDETGKERVYSLVINRSYTTNNSMAVGAVDQNLIFLPEENQLVMMKGLIGNHPNLFVTLKMDNAFEFADKIKNIRSQQDWTAFRDQYAIHRNDVDFWKIYDEFIEWQRRDDPLSAGVIDLNLYQMFN